MRVYIHLCDSPSLYKLPWSNYLTRSHPNVSVILAAVAALIALPTPGIQPISTCYTVRPTVEAATEPIAAKAVDSVRDLPKTRPNEMVMVS